jgi:hypothetical protein
MYAHIIHNKKVHNKKVYMCQKHRFMRDALFIFLVAQHLNLGPLRTFLDQVPNVHIVGPYSAEGKQNGADSLTFFLMAHCRGGFFSLQRARQMQAWEVLPTNQSTAETGMTPHTT